MGKLYETAADLAELPSADYYVLSNDTFMSGWGPAEHKTNVCVVPCRDYPTAQRVAEYARSRSDQKRVRIVANKPRPRRNVCYSLVGGWIETSKER